LRHKADGFSFCCSGGSNVFRLFFVPLFCRISRLRFPCACSRCFVVLLFRFSFFCVLWSFVGHYFTGGDSAMLWYILLTNGKMRVSFIERIRERNPASGSAGVCHPPMCCAFVLFVLFVSSQAMSP
ncbi:unnamed protein product, partial [Pylaiella littoralis]